jgi:hypothetical protein
MDTVFNFAPSGGYVSEFKCFSGRVGIKITLFNFRLAIKKGGKPQWFAP